MAIGREPSETCHEIDCGIEFLFSEPHFACKSVQMFDQRLNDLLDARVLIEVFIRFSIRYALGCVVDGMNFLLRSRLRLEGI